MTQHAIIADATGGPEVLVWKERDTALVAGGGELLVKTAAAGVNFVETYQRSGIYPMELPFTLGAEGAGTVIAVGDGVEGFNVGDRVTTCEGRFTYGEEFLVEAEKAIRIPDDVSFEVAAAIPLQGLTAHYLCTSSSNPELGETVLVHAGAGGVGLLLTQMLASRGVTVITTASTEEKRAESLKAGAAHSIGYEDFATQVRELTDGVGVSVVYDGVGKDTFDGSLEALAVRGNMVLFGGASGQVPPFDLQRLNQEGSLSVTRPSIQHFLLTAEERAWRYGEILSALSDGTLNFKVGETFPMSEAGAAHTALESRATSGKVVLTVS